MKCETRALHTGLGAGAGPLYRRIHYGRNDGSWPARAARRPSASCSSLCLAVSPIGAELRSCSSFSQPLALAIGRNRSEWGSPREALESRVVAIRGNPFAAGFDGQGRKPSVLHNVSRGFGILAQGFEYRPVTFAGHDHRRGGLSKNNATKLEGIIQGAGTCKNPRMGTDAHDADEYLRCDAVSGWPVDHRFEPCPVSRVIFGV